MPLAGERPDSSSTRFAYPVFLDLHGVFVLVVGGGPIGARKCEGLAAAGARVRLVAPSISESLDVEAIAEVHERAFRPSDLDDVRLVVAATGDQAVDAEVSSAARERGIFVNAADQPVDCDFILPAIARTGRITAAISTDGASPTLASELRNLVTELLTPEVANLAEELSAERAAVHAAGDSTEKIDWKPRVRAALDEALRGNSLRG